MKANEIEDGKVLMIGDLVIGCIETDILGEATYKILCKVTGINHYEDVECEALEPFPDDLDWQDGDDFSWLEAIPLTPEILEKNGFVKQGYPGWLIYTEEYMIQWRNDYPNLLSIDSFSSNYGSFKGFIVDYVHQLQHALRLCGIEKEIEI